ncbi:unnamed protein product, partial [Owenia fusiformis]
TPGVGEKTTPSSGGETTPGGEQSTPGTTVEVCREIMGIENGLITDDMFSASSEKSPEHAPERGRLNLETDGVGAGGWTPAESNINQWIQIDFLEPRILTGVTIQGRDGVPTFVTSFEVIFSYDGLTWTKYEETPGVAKVFPGNTDNETPVTNWFYKPIRGQFIRIVPLTWNQAISIRLEIHGCYEPYPTKPTGTVPTTTPAVTTPKITTPGSTTTTTPWTMPPMECVEFEDWVNTGAVSLEGDLEPIDAIINVTPNCQNPIAIQCRKASSDKTPHYKTGQVVSCNLWEGLSCRHADQQNQPFCYDYEVRLGCLMQVPECLPSTATPGTTPTGTPPIGTTPANVDVCENVTEISGCPASCPEGKFCDGKDCVSRIDCPCVINNRYVKPGEFFETENCETCTCFNGQLKCYPKTECPPCPDGQMPKRDQETQCQCTCLPCVDGGWMCDNFECIPPEARCDGVIDCTNDEYDCASTTAAPTTTPPVSTRSTPSGTGTTPSGVETTPSEGESTPSKEETTPEGEKTTPSGVETTPSGKETTPEEGKTTGPPSVSGSTPSGEVTTPSGEKTTPSGEKTTPSGVETTPKEETPGTIKTCPVCPTLIVPVLKPGEVAVIKEILGGCCEEYEVICKPDTCPEVDIICEAPKRVYSIIGECCQGFECKCPPIDECNVTPEPECPPGYQTVQRVDECGCVSYENCTKQSVCIIRSTYTYDEEGNQVPRPEPITIVKQPGETWDEGDCRSCECTASPSGIPGEYEPLCSEQTCPAPPPAYDLGDKIPGECCRPLVKNRCIIRIDGEDETFNVDDEWSNPDTPCVSYKCVRSPDGDAIVETATGLCCVVNGISYQPGEMIPSNRTCYEAICDASEHGALVIESTINCVPPNRTCAQGEDPVDESGCCRKCIPSEPKVCDTCRPVLVFGQPQDSIGYLTSEKQGMLCSNKDVVDGFYECSGFCDSRAQYSTWTMAFVNDCDCCQPRKTESKFITLTCDDGSTITKSYQVPSECGCGACTGARR